MRRWRGLVWSGLATVLALALLLGLGAWQMRRLAEKQQVLAALSSAMTASPLALDGPEVATLTVVPSGQQDLPQSSLPELRRVTVKGEFITTRSVPVRATLPTPSNARSLGGLGYFWMTPLRMENGVIVFINRGFVPTGADFKAPAIMTPAGPQVITGLLRLPEKAQMFTPADNPAKGEYFIRDPQIMAKNAALPAVANFFIDAERTTSEALNPPVGVEAREMIARIPNNHLQYAMTWFGLAMTLIGVFGFYAYARLRSDQGA